MLLKASSSKNWTKLSKQQVLALERIKAKIGDELFQIYENMAQDTRKRLKSSERSNRKSYVDGEEKAMIKIEPKIFSALKIYDTSVKSTPSKEKAPHPILPIKPLPTISQPKEILETSTKKPIQDKYDHTDKTILSGKIQDSNPTSKDTHISLSPTVKPEKSKPQETKKPDIAKEKSDQQSNVTPQNIPDQIDEEHEQDSSPSSKDASSVFSHTKAPTKLKDSTPLTLVHHAQDKSASTTIPTVESSSSLPIQPNFPSFSTDLSLLLPSLSQIHGSILPAATRRVSVLLSPLSGPPISHIVANSLSKAPALFSIIEFQRQVILETVAQHIELERSFEEYKAKSTRDCSTLRVAIRKAVLDRGKITQQREELKEKIRELQTEIWKGQEENRKAKEEKEIEKQISARKEREIDILRRSIGRERMSAIESMREDTAFLDPVSYGSLYASGNNKGISALGSSSSSQGSGPLSPRYNNPFGRSSSSSSGVSHHVGESSSNSKNRQISSLEKQVEMLKKLVGEKEEDLEIERQKRIDLDEKCNDLERSLEMYDMTHRGRMWDSFSSHAHPLQGSPRSLLGRFSNLSNSSTSPSSSSHIASFESFPMSPSASSLLSRCLGENQKMRKTIAELKRSNTILSKQHHSKPISKKGPRVSYSTLLRGLGTILLSPSSSSSLPSLHKSTVELSRVFKKEVKRVYESVAVGIAQFVCNVGSICGCEKEVKLAALLCDNPSRSHQSTSARSKNAGKKQQSGGIVKNTNRGHSMSMSVQHTGSKNRSSTTPKIRSTPPLGFDNQFLEKRSPMPFSTPHRISLVSIGKEREEKKRREEEQERRKKEEEEERRRREEERKRREEKEEQERKKEEERMRKEKEEEEEEEHNYQNDFEDIVATTIQNTSFTKPTITATLTTHQDDRTIVNDDRTIVNDDKQSLGDNTESEYSEEDERESNSRKKADSDGFISPSESDSLSERLTPMLLTVTTHRVSIPSTSLSTDSPESKHNEKSISHFPISPTIIPSSQRSLTTGRSDSMTLHQHHSLSRKLINVPRTSIDMGEDVRVNSHSSVVSKPLGGSGLSSQRTVTGIHDKSLSVVENTSRMPRNSIDIGENVHIHFKSRPKTSLGHVSDTSLSFSDSNTVQYSHPRDSTTLDKSLEEFHGVDIDQLDKGVLQQVELSTVQSLTNKH
ncbi:hypothetical protein ADUPG1_008002, partial [Aduncisulcus paluster]